MNLPTAAATLPAPRTANDTPPQLAAGVERLGEYRGSGLTEVTYLVRNSRGQVVHLSRLLHLVLSEIDGSRTTSEIASRATIGFGRTVSADNVEYLLAKKFAPLGLVATSERAHPGTPAAGRGQAILTLKGRRTLVPAPAVQHIARLFEPLFSPLAVGAVLACLIASDGWLFRRAPIGTAFRYVLFNPLLLLLVLSLSLLSMLFHEFGHAAACRYGGARPGVIGIGLYVMWPAFYTNVTDSYRLSRTGRLRTSLGGIYFNAVFALLLTATYLATSYPPLLVTILLVYLEIVQQLLPSLRFDGYFIVADLIGVPDLFGRIAPTLRSMIPGRMAEPRVRDLKRSARISLTAWVALVVPLLTVQLALIILHAPSLAKTFARSLHAQANAVVTQFGRVDIAAGVMSTVAVVMLVLPMAGLCYTLLLTGRKILRYAIIATRGRVPARAAHRDQRREGDPVSTAIQDVVSPDLRKALRTLKLGQMLHTLPERLTLARQQKMTHADFLELVLTDEATRREAKSAAVRHDRQLWSHMQQSDINAQLTNFSEKTPPRDFDTVLRGYDRSQVDAHLKQLEAKIRQHREQVQAMQRELSKAHHQIQEQKQPTYSSLGARIEQLLQLAEEQATELVQAARSEANEIKAAATIHAAETHATAENKASELRANARRETDDLRDAAEREAKAIRASVRRETEDLTSTTEREVATLRTTANHEIAEKRAAAELDIAKLRTSTEHEVTQLRATTKRERDQILTAAKRQANEMRAQAQRILEESNAQRAQDEAEFETQLASRREEAEHHEAKRLAAAQAATQKLVTEAEQRAATAEQRAAKTSAQAEQTRREAEQHANQLVTNTKKHADQVLSQAKAQAGQHLAHVKAEAERHRAAAQRQVDELTRQKDSISGHLARLYQLLGAQIPGLEDALPPSQQKPTIGGGQQPRPAQQAGPPQGAAPPRDIQGARGAPPPQKQPVPTQTAQPGPKEPNHNQDS